MNNDKAQILDVLQQQLAWVLEQDLILAKIEGKLRVMKELATYRLAHELSFGEVQQLNENLVKLQEEVKLLEAELYKGTVH